jgi:hypothetical protein
MASNDLADRVFKEMANSTFRYFRRYRLNEIVYPAQSLRHFDEDSVDARRRAERNAATASKDKPNAV